MSAQDPEQPPAASGSGSSRRRSSFADMFSRQPVVDVGTANGARSSAMAAAMAQQQQQQQRPRRLSVSALGLSGSPTRGSGGASAFETLKDKSLAGRQRTASTTGDETAVEDGDAVAPLNGDSGSSSRPTSPSLTRRLSFGTMAYRDSMRASSGSSNPDSSLSPDGSGSSGGVSPPSSARKAEGFNWSENLRTRAQRSSISHSQGGGGNGFVALTSGGRAKGPPEPVTTSAPAAPKSLPPKTPDHFQERILKGDFYMD